jgi:hypothetical protein
MSRRPYAAGTKVPEMQTARIHHPDQGGDAEVMAELNAAIEAARSSRR